MKPFFSKRRFVAARKRDKWLRRRRPWIILRRLIYMLWSREIRCSCIRFPEEWQKINGYWAIISAPTRFSFCWLFFLYCCCSLDVGRVFTPLCLWRWPVWQYSMYLFQQSWQEKIFIVGPLLHAFIWPWWHSLLSMAWTGKVSPQCWAVLPAYW